MKSKSRGNVSSTYATLRRLQQLLTRHPPAGASFADDYYTSGHEPTDVLRWYDAMTANARDEHGVLTNPSGKHDGTGRQCIGSAINTQYSGGSTSVQSYTKNNNNNNSSSNNNNIHPRRFEEAGHSTTRSSSPLVLFPTSKHDYHSNSSSCDDDDDGGDGKDGTGHDSDISSGSEYARHHRYDIFLSKSNTTPTVVAARRTGESVARNGNASVVYMYTSDPYDRKREMDNQDRFISESKRVGKPFLASGGARTLEKPTRMLLGDFVRELYRTVLSDWAKAAPMIVSTAEDLIVVFFSVKDLSERQEKVLLQYMNSSLLHNETMRRFFVDKVNEGWHMRTSDGYLMYTLRPPWVKKRFFLPATMMRHTV